MAMANLGPALLDICDELLLHILAYLEIPELLACSRTTHRLRTLALDPLLHTHRLRSASHHLSLTLPHRPALSSLRPPLSTIYLSATHVAARQVHWSMLRIRLSRRLSRRPSAGALVRSGILPGECCAWDGRRGEVVWGVGRVAPGIVGVRRRVERERLKDWLRGWVGGWMGVVEKRRGEVVRGRLMAEGRGEGEKRKRERERELGEVMGGRVWGLRRFWEGVGGGRRLVDWAVVRWGWAFALACVWWVVWARAGGWDFFICIWKYLDFWIRPI